MALDKDELQQILEMFKAEGWRMCLPTENLEDVKDFRLELGELCNLPKEKIIKIGNGIDTIEDLPYIEYANKKTDQDDSMAVVIQHLWDDIQRNTTRFQIWTGLMPEECIELFINLAPPNFSFMRGEPLPDESPISCYWENAPNAEGVIFRNYHFENASRDDISRKLGDYQSDATQKWTGNIVGRAVGTKGMFATDANGIVVPYDINTGGWVDGRSSSYSIAHAVSLDNSRVVRTSNENRPKNVLTISVWRTY